MSRKITRIAAIVAACATSAILAVSLSHTGPAASSQSARETMAADTQAMPQTYVYTVMFSTPTSDTNPNKTAETLAASIQRALRRLGYTHVTVAGSSLLTSP
jgi:hypothetical protein